MNDDDVYYGGPLVIAPPNSHWYDLRNGVCSRCGELVDAIETLDMKCRETPGAPDYLGLIHAVVGTG